MRRVSRVLSSVFFIIHHKLRTEIEILDLERLSHIISKHIEFFVALFISSTIMEKKHGSSSFSFTEM
ncbi:hypothetical protein H5410_024836 [Solanum commersonii]|uniref:Uncharacterized protein n=1 Tax=Solanum commersonii TaxID=4109 RepID=A0A9J5ZN50_SOLCO|nr:hypothetical protein H5410_024836 [Solanum commersonii]